MQVVLAPGVLDYGFVYFVACGAYRVIDDDAAKRNNRYLGSTAAYVHHHRAYRLLHRQARADSGSHWLLDRISLTRPRINGGVMGRAALHFGHAGGDADNHAGLGGHQALGMDFLDEVLQHRLDHVEVSDHTVFERANSDDMSRRLA